ncbi:hypothetical protein ASE04_21170 [Rhizobium sp. Root708]|nr:hypothetical protein ASE04_21170 [Rhizobium sp. Root708]
MSHDLIFVTEGQLAKRLGLTLDMLKTALPAATQAGFPDPDPLFANRRYWPACSAWLDRRYGLSGSADGPYPPDEQEPWKPKAG